MGVFQLEQRCSLWISHRVHPRTTTTPGSPPATSCQILLTDGAAEIRGCPLRKNHPVDLAAEDRDVLIDTDTGCIVQVVTDRFCFVSEPEDRRCRRRQLRDYCLHPRPVTMIVSEGTEVVETLRGEFARLCTPCLVVDLDGHSGVLTPRYMVGTARERFFHYPVAGKALSPGVSSRLASEIQDFRHCGGVVLVNSFSCRYSSSHAAFLRSVELLGISQVGVVDASDLYQTAKGQLPPGVGLSELLPWPSLQTTAWTAPPPLPPQEEAALVGRLRGLVRHVPMAPSSCLPIGYVRQLTDSFQVDLTYRPTTLPHGRFGITPHVPTLDTLSTVGYSALVRCDSRGVVLLAGSLPVVGSDVYLVTWAVDLTFRVEEEETIGS